MKKDDTNKSAPMSPAKKGLFAFVFSLLIGAAIFTSAYMPWKAYREIEMRCTEAATGNVIEKGAQEKEDTYYYGPELEYCPPGSQIFYRTVVVNTVKLNGTWEKGEALSLYYNPSDPSEIILRDEHTAENRYRVAFFVTALLAALGLGALITGCVVNFLRTRPRNYDKNIAGQSFEQWQADKAEADAKAEAVSAEKQTDKEE